jgi:hypothetical protein
MPVKKTTKTIKTTKKSLKKTKKTKKPMPEGYARCMICDKAVKMINPSVKTTKNGRKRLTGKLECGHHQGNRFIK